MIRYLKNRLARFVDDCIKQRIDTIAAVAGSRVDLDKIAVRVPFDRGQMVDEILERVKTAHTVDYEQLAECLDVTEVAAHMDTSDIDWDYSQVTDGISLSDLAGELDYSSLAGEIDTSNIASEVEVDAAEVAEHLDYQRLACALLDAVRAGN